MKTLYTASAIEALVSSGQTALTLGPNDILTPLARDRARELGLQLRSGSETSPGPAAPQLSAPRPPVVAPGLASDALAAFTGLLQLTRRDQADAPHLARCFDDLLRAVDQGETITLPHSTYSASLPLERRQALAEKIAQLTTLAHYLFGPAAPHRRFDILWALTALQQMINN